MKRNLYLTHIAVLVAFAVVIHTVEAALPVPMPVPGVRLGLANVITLLAISLFGFRSGLLVAVLRTVLGSLLIGHFLGFGFWLSLSGGLVSSLAMAAVMPLVHCGQATLITASVLGAAVHNLVQIAVASAIIGNFALFRGYYPLLLLLAVPTGIVTGLAAAQLETVTRRVLYQVGGLRESNG